MILELAPDDLLTTTRSVRKRLDYDRPVPRDVVESCAQLAFQAPNGSNQQNWGWVCVDDPALKVAMADLYRRGMRDHIDRDRTGERPYNPGGDARAQERMSEVKLSARLGMSRGFLRKRLKQFGLEQSGDDN